MRHLPNRLSAVVGLWVLACVPGGDAPGPGWEGRVESSPAGVVHVYNEGHGLWGPDEAWEVTEELRVGKVDGAGPESFGRIASIAVDERGRILVLESQAAELRVFNASGQHVRTIGRQGGGPGEFGQPLRVDVGPDGNTWVMDPQNARLSVFDSAGAYLRGIRYGGGFMVFPWHGGFDAQGRYYAPVPRFEPEFSVSLGRFDSDLAPIDTIDLPRDPKERESFSIAEEGRGIRAGIPFQGRQSWERGPDNTLWTLQTDEYHLFQMSFDGDTLLRVSRRFEPLDVTAEDRAEAVEQLKWFTDQGGEIDVSRFPSEKPPTRFFFVDDEGNVWVALETSDEDRQPVEVFGADGRFLGGVVLPFRLQNTPGPILREGSLYAVIQDALDVQYVVRARVERSK